MDNSDMAVDYVKVIKSLVAKSQSTYGERIKKAILPLGNDFSNSDNLFSTTTQGTQQQNSLTWQQGITTQSEIAIWATGLLLESFDEVEVHLIPGNHDEFSNFWLYTMLKQVYKNTDNITIKGGRRWSITQHGEVGVFFAHGHKGKSMNYVQTWATSDPKSFASTTYREIHKGHLHGRAESTLSISEEYGIVVRTMPGLSGTDDWHDSNFYINNNRLGLATVYNKIAPQGEVYAYVKDIA